VSDAVDWTSDDTGHEQRSLGAERGAPHEHRREIPLHAAHEEGDVAPFARFLLEGDARLEHRVEAAVGEAREDREDRERHEKLDESESGRAALTG
jgi:hypothetical protein